MLIFRYVSVLSRMDITKQFLNTPYTGFSNTHYHLSQRRGKDRSQFCQGTGGHPVASRISMLPDFALTCGWKTRSTVKVGRGEKRSERGME